MWVSSTAAHLDICALCVSESQTYSSEDTTTVTLRAQIVDFFISAIITVALKEVIIATEIGPFLNFFSKKVLDCFSMKVADMADIF